MCEAGSIMLGIGIVALVLGVPGSLSIKSAHGLGASGAGGFVLVLIGSVLVGTQC